MFKYFENYNTRTQKTRLLLPGTKGEPESDKVVYFCFLSHCSLSPSLSLSLSLSYCPWTWLWQVWVLKRRQPMDVAEDTCWSLASSPADRHILTWSTLANNLSTRLAPEVDRKSPMMVHSHTFCWISQTDDSLRHFIQPTSKPCCLSKNAYKKIDSPSTFVFVSLTGPSPNIHPSIHSPTYAHRSSMP